MRDIYTPYGGPPQGSPPPREIYEEIGEEGIRKILSLHYKKLGQSPVKHLFPAGEKELEQAAQKSADFFIQLLGGPAMFSQKHGPPRMRARHMPFEITVDARNEWLKCFHEALDETGFPQQYREPFDEFLDSFSMWMVNSDRKGL